jgi:hypothetical protein
LHIKTTMGKPVRLYWEKWSRDIIIASEASIYGLTCELCG